MIVTITMTRDEHNELVLQRRMPKTLAVKCIRAGVVMEASIIDVDVDKHSRPTYRILGDWTVIKRDTKTGHLHELRVDQEG